MKTSKLVKLSIKISITTSTAIIFSEKNCDVQQ